MSDFLLISRQRSGSTALDHLLSDNGLAAAKECLMAVPPNRSGIDFDARFTQFCKSQNIDAGRMIEDCDGLLDEYRTYLRKLYDVPRVALGVKTNHIYNIPGRSYISPYRPALVRYSLTRKMGIVLLKRKNLFLQYLSNLFANETGLFHQHIDPNKEFEKHQPQRSSKDEKILVDVKKAQRAMNDATEIYKRIAGWYRGYGNYNELIYEEIFDTQIGGITELGVSELERIFAIKIKNQQLQTKKLQRDYKAQIANVDEITDHFSGSPMEQHVVSIFE